jgi:hypothetical protein
LHSQTLTELTWIFHYIFNHAVATAATNASSLTASSSSTTSTTTPSTNGGNDGNSASMYMSDALAMFQSFSSTTTSYADDLQRLIAPSAHAPIVAMLQSQSDPQPLSTIDEWNITITEEVANDHQSRKRRHHDDIITRGVIRTRAYTLLRRQWKRAKQATDLLFGGLRTHINDLLPSSTSGSGDMIATDDYDDDTIAAAAAASGGHGGSATVTTADVREMLTQLVDLKDQWASFDVDV